jgi:hypothetical protein
MKPIRMRLCRDEIADLLRSLAKRQGDRRIILAPCPERMEPCPECVLVELREIKEGGR